MRPGVDYYALLGVTRDVSADELKRVYRQLVRQHHPDVAAQGDAAHDRFVAIVEAYRTLSDPVRRRAYDALRAGSGAPPVTQQTQLGQQIDDWFRHAVHQLEQCDLSGAAAQCRKILALDGGHAAAHALLGDVCVARQDWDQALVHFSSAVSSAPRNPVYARKLRDAAEAGQTARAAEERRQASRRRRERAREALIARHSMTPYTAVLLAGWLVALLAWARQAEPQPVAWWLPLSYAVTVASLGSGFLSGLLLGLSRWIEPRDGRRGVGWLAWVMATIALVSFYLAAAFYCVVAVVRGRAAATVTAAFVLTGGLVALVTAIAFHSPGGGAAVSWPVALWSGNLIFPSLLAGQRLARAALREA